MESLISWWFSKGKTALEVATEIARVNRLPVSFSIADRTSLMLTALAAPPPRLKARPLT